jgi:hypothetical protein
MYRLAPRSIEVLELHKDKQPAIAVFEETLPPAANRVITLSAQLRAYGSTRIVEQVEGKTGLTALLQKTRAWGAIVDKLLGGASLKPLCARPDVPEDVIHDAVDLIGVVERRIDEGMPEPSFFAAMKADLEPVIEAARHESTQAATANTAYQELQAELRKACKAFQAELVAFRRTLAAFLGRSHRDYQRLRSSRVSRDDEADAIDDGDDFEEEDELEEGTEVAAAEAAE